MIVAVIPIRSGSKGLKNKNIRKLGSKPLVAWAIEAAKQTRFVDRVIVSTESQRYAEIAESYGAEVPFLRPKELAEDVPSELVIIHAAKELGIRKYDKESIILTLQCTTPFVQALDIDACVARCKQEDADSAMTMCEVSERPEWSFRIYPAGKVYPVYQDVTPQGEWGVRQSLPTYYRPNGACYATRTHMLYAKRRIIGTSCYPVLMPRIRSIDIDTEEDFLMAKAVVKAGLHL